MMLLIAILAAGWVITQIMTVIAINKLDDRIEKVEEKLK